MGEAGSQTVELNSGVCIVADLFWHSNRMINRLVFALKLFHLKVIAVTSYAHFKEVCHNYYRTDLGFLNCLAETLPLNSRVFKQVHGLKPIPVSALQV